MLNLERYFSRIDYRGQAYSPALNVLRELHELHTQTIPFENINSLIGVPTLIDLPSIVEKLVNHRRGGYCFEQNTLFYNVLMELGFCVTPLIARVLWGGVPSSNAACTHMLLRVDLEGKSYICDVGFGGVTLPTPIELVAGKVQQTSFEWFRLVASERETLELEVELNGVWKKIYRFDLRPAEWIDYELANWYTSTFPMSHFLSNLVICRISHSGRLTLSNKIFTERSMQFPVRRKNINSVNDLVECLRDKFNLDTTTLDLRLIFSKLI
ncbi:arylamine N-acetyltransferase [Paraburkholderia bonniea]|uniref:arylamine N-acetyltransferase family protein n=1 Tax=Paraburkholderia bonniea TaxID=2152891 RepID=UPI00257307A1|nr:arylamine N-acetyltransferase [Paraburkholderia bonniea]WJF91561.1 arylamine N-acetyltransferase [Paraburkholderia bonniea]WJF94881.1 arylamine N-acetyltransferase [Paraburkholderia bonniea]